MHKQSTLSTEQSTNVDNTMDCSVDVLITYEETAENRTENETSGETNSSEKIEISGENKTSSETEKSGAIQKETQELSDECPEQSTEFQKQSTECPEQSTEHQEQGTECQEQSTERQEQGAECQEQSTEYQEQSTERPEQSAEHTEETTESHTETLSEEEEELQEVFSDAVCYYSFYASIFHSRDESTSMTFDQETFENAYESIKEEPLEQYFESCEWISREEGISLSLTPKTILFPDGNADVYSWEARCIHAFALLRAAYETDEHWDNGDSLKPQFHCHAIYARQNKVPWNIEPYRTETSFLRILLTWGNPES